MSFHADALGASLAANCVLEKEGIDVFFQYNDLLYANDDLSADGLIGYANDLGLDVDEFTNCFENEEYLDAIAQDQNLADALGLMGTPSFWIGDQLIAGAQSYEVFEKGFEELLGN